jgi:hypothetical protein
MTYRNKFSKRILVYGWLVLFSGVPYGAHAEVLARVNGMEITDQDVKIAEEDVGDAIPQTMSHDERLRYILDYLIALNLLSKTAISNNLQQNPDFEHRASYYHNKALMYEQLMSSSKNAISDDTVQKAYNDSIKEHPSLESARPKIEQYLIQKSKIDFLKNLRDISKIEYLDNLDKKTNEIKNIAK